MTHPPRTVAPKRRLWHAALLLLVPPLLGALLGAWAFVTVLHDPLGATPAPPAPVTDGGWATLLTSVFGLFGAGVGGAIGLVVGLVASGWYWWARRAI